MPLSDPLDESVERMLTGDEHALRTVYRAVHPPLLRYLTVLVGPDDAEDVASEAWAQAFRDLDRFAGGADGFRGWLTTIGRNRALDHLRRRQRQPRADVPLGDLLDRPDDADVESTVVGVLGTETALAMVASLPVDQAEAIMLRTVLGLDAPTAARILGKRPGAVRSATHRGLRALARQPRRRRPRAPRTPTSRASAGRSRPATRRPTARRSTAPRSARWSPRPAARTPSRRTAWHSSVSRSRPGSRPPRPPGPPPPTRSTTGKPTTRPTPSGTPTSLPAQAATGKPTTGPTPSGPPTAEPTRKPTTVPSPTGQPTGQPTDEGRPAEPGKPETSGKP